MPVSFAAAVESADGTVEQRTFDVSRMYNLGSATRDSQVAVHHQEEVAAAGVRIAFDIPAPRIYPIAPYALTTSDVVEVHGGRTSGEVEIVLVVADDDIFVGVGSDHTDRELERVSIVYSKQTCANVLAPRLWRLSEVADHWDDCVIESWVDDTLYQQTFAGTFLSPKDLLETVRQRANPPESGFVLYAGTIVALQGQLAYGSRWSFRLHDPVLSREISHTYRLEPLMAEMADGFRVPLTVEGR